MKKISIIVLCCCCFLMGVAQQKPQYTQYIFNNYLLNPAISGIENYTDIKIGYRRQWEGIENAPKTAFLSLNFNLNKDFLWKNPLSLSEPNEDPMSKNYMQNYTASPPHHGAGLTLVSDKTGPLSRTDVNLTYAYHLKLTDRLNLSTGIAGGISIIKVNIQDLVLENPKDVAIENLIASQVKPDLSVGVWLYGSSYFLGASIQQIIPQKLKFTSVGSAQNSREQAHFFITTGYRFFMAEEISVIPSFMIKKVANIPMSIDYNAKFALKEKVWLGASYRTEDSFAAFVGVNFKKLINFTYSYDFTTSSLNKVGRGSHEIIMGFQINALYQAKSWIPIW